MSNRSLILRLLLAAVLTVGALTAGGCTSNGPSASSERPTAAQSAAPISGGATETSADTPLQPPTAPAATSPSKPLPGLTAATVVRVVDGDTAIFAIKGRNERVRFIGVDTPESTTQHEPYGAEAAAYTKRILTPGLKVHLENDLELRDRYQRLLAYVWLEAPTARTDAELRAKQFNARLLLRGYGQQMTIQPNSRYADFYTVYAREAREQNRGLWALPLEGGGSKSGSSNPTRPSSTSYVGSRRSHKFHRTDCQWGRQIASANLVVFKTRAEAISAGYVPCKVCKP